MRAAPATPPDGVPADLARLRDLLGDLPRKNVRWQTPQGQRFLDELYDASLIHSQAAIGRALDKSPQTISNWLDRHRGKAQPYPTPDELRALRAAWRRLGDRPSTVSRTTVEYGLVHRALLPLRAKYSRAAVAAGLDVQSRALQRFETPPLGAPADLARAVKQQLPRQGGCDEQLDSDLREPTGGNGKTEV